MTVSAATVQEKPAFWDEASAQLMGRDRILRKVIPQHQSEWLGPSATPFITLARALVGHQISVKSAEAMWQRFTEACGRNPTPRAVLGLAETDVKLLGLSKRKADYVI